MIPNLFKKQDIPKKIPKELEKKIKEFSKNKNKEEFLKKAFFYLVDEWKGSRAHLVLNLSRLFQKDLSKILKTKGYMHCTTMNYLLRVMAVKSGFFTDEDIEVKLTHSWYMLPHQYLLIKINTKKSITLDPWNYQFGIEYGKYGKGFASRKFSPMR